MFPGRAFLCLIGILAAWTFAVPAQELARASARPIDEADTRPPVLVPYTDVRPLLQALRSDLVPEPLRLALASADGEQQWKDWVARHDREIRDRLVAGDEDSVINFLLFGTTFTSLERLKERDVADMADGLPRPALVDRRIQDLIAALSSPGDNERLQFTRAVLARHQMVPGTPNGNAGIGRWLTQGVSRVAAEYRRQAGIVHDPGSSSITQSTLYRDRGLSSDTTIFPAFGVEQTLEALRSNKLLDPAMVRRVAVIGPGLDFTDKHEGFDFYPQQTIQPFAVIDSLTRLGLARPGAVQVTTLDLSARVNDHLRAARRNTHAGQSYVLHLPKTDVPFRWTPYLASYWQQLGNTIGVPVPASAPAMDGVAMRAVRLHSSIVESVHPQDANIVVQRLERAGFDLVIATNVLIYYDVFDQSLALLNVAHMLRPGGIFVTNTPVSLLPSIPVELFGYTEVGYTDRPEGDRFFWYRRQ
jgi:hypothetical protein